MVLRLQNRLDELATLQTALDAFAEGQRLPPQATIETALLLEELFVNVVSHAFPDRLSHQITVSLERRGDWLEIECADDGVAFDPLTAPPADTESPLEERPIGGLGIHFIRHYSDDLAYRREQGRNILTIRKRLADAPSEEPWKS